MPENKQFKKRGIILGIFLFIIISISLIYAAPPVTQIQQFNTGYVIQIPQDNILKVLEPHIFSFHVSNISNGALINESVTCLFHIYNSTGEHQLEMIQSTSQDKIDYTFIVEGGNFTELGNSYYYFISCISNNNNFGGSQSSPLIVTSNGDEIDISQSLIYIILLIINLLFLALLIILAIKIPYENKKENTRDGPAVVKIVKLKYVKLMCIWFSYGLFLWLITILTGMINNYISFEPLKDMIINVYLFASTLSYGITIGIVWLIFLNTWRDIILNKKILKDGKALLKEL